MSDAADPAQPGPALRARLTELLDSYRQHTGRSLCGLDELYQAPFAVLAHGTEQPPVLWYGNQRALDLWKMSFADFTCMPSLRTAEPDRRDERERLLREVRERGICLDYTGVRVASDGGRFRIEKAAVWNVLGAEGRVVGQAAMCATVVPL